MANSDKNIVITPNRNGGDSTYPVVTYTGQSGTSIVLNVVDDTSLLWTSTTGHLFTVSNSGNPLVVRTGSGAPLLQCQSDGNIRMLPRSGGKVYIGGNTNGNALLNINSSSVWPNNTKDQPSIECTSIRFNGGQFGFVQSVQAMGHIYCTARSPDNGSGSFPFNQYGALVLQASTTSGYNNDICFVTGSAAIGSTPSPTVKLRLNESGNLRVGDGNNPGSYRLEVNGSINASSEIVAFSDERLKENIETIDTALDKVLNLRGVYYTRKDKEEDNSKINNRYIGVIAQEVEKVIPEVICESSDGIKSVAYGNIVGLLIEAIKDLNSEIVDLKERLGEKNNGK